MKQIHTGEDEKNGDILSPAQIEKELDSIDFEAEAERVNDTGVEIITSHDIGFNHRPEDLGIFPLHTVLSLYYDNGTVRVYCGGTYAIKQGVHFQPDLFHTRLQAVSLPGHPWRGGMIYKDNGLERLRLLCTGDEELRRHKISVVFPYEEPESDLFSIVNRSLSGKAAQEVVQSRTNTDTIDGLIYLLQAKRTRYTTEQWRENSAFYEPVVLCSIFREYDPEERDQQEIMSTPPIPIDPPFGRVKAMIPRLYRDYLQTADEIFTVLGKMRNPDASTTISKHA